MTAAHSDERSAADGGASMIYVVALDQGLRAVTSAHTTLEGALQRAGEHVAASGISPGRQAEMIDNARQRMTERAQSYQAIEEEDGQGDPEGWLSVDAVELEGANRLLDFVETVALGNTEMDALEGEAKRLLLEGQLVPDTAGADDEDDAA